MNRGSIEERGPQEELRRSEERFELLVQSVKDYPWSTFQKFVKLGEYEENWGDADPCPDWDEPEWE